MKKCIIFIIGLSLILSSVFIAGCASNAPSTSLPTFGSKLSTIEPIEMALKLSDLPSGFTIKEGTERTSSDVGQKAHANGWKKGYFVEFDRSGTGKTLETEMIMQDISVYPIDNVNQIMANAQSKILKEAYANETVEQLSDPKIGDSSQAFRVKKNIFGIPITSFVIYFAKGDVVETIIMTGTSADYATLNQLAKVAAAKIR